MKFTSYFNFSKVSEKIEPLEENSSQSDSGQRIVDEKSNGKISGEIVPSEENLSQSDSDQRIEDEKSIEKVSIDFFYIFRLLFFVKLKIFFY